jgi:hypothetical protein
MGRELRRLLALAQCAAVACAVVFLGFTPGTGGAGAGGHIIAAVEEHHPRAHNEHGWDGNERAVPSHCHPGLDCSLAAVFIGGSGLTAQSANATWEAGFHDLELSGDAPSFDPPPPRRVS